MAERLLPSESDFVARDAVPNPWHVTDVAVFAGDGLTVAEVTARVEERLAYVPRFRQHPHPTLTGEVWVDAADFDVSRHVRELPLPPRATVAQLQARVAELLHEPLTRRGPRWDLSVVPSLRGRRSALVARVNPAWVDGIGGVHLLSELLDDFPNPEPPQPAPWEPAPAEAGDPVVASLLDVGREPLPALTGAATLAARLARVGLASVGVGAPVRQPRHVAGTGAPLALLQRAAARADARVHDVVVAMVAGGLRRIGERVDPVAVVAQAVTESGEPSALGMRVRPDVVALPVRTPSAAGRLEHIASLTQARVEAGGLVGAAELAAAPGFLAPTLHTVAAREAVAAGGYDVLIADVPGPRTPRYLDERELRASYPVLSTTGSQRLTVGVTSYAGQVLFGITGVQPVAELADAMLDELHELAG